MPKVDDTGQQWFSDREMVELQVAGRVSRLEEARPYYGKSLTPGHIENAIICAGAGYMKDITDIGLETLGFDPHLASEVGKRVRAVGSVEPKVVARKTVEPSPEAEKARAFVEAQLGRIPRLQQRIVNLAWGTYHGRAALEVEWEESTGAAAIRAGAPRWRVKDLHWIHKRRLAFGRARDIWVRDSNFTGGRGFEDRGFPIEQLPWKFIVSKRQLFDDYPEREGLNPRTMYFSHFKRMGWRWRMELLEVFGKPWRWVEVDGNPAVNVDIEQLKLAKETADKMGGNASGMMGKGIKLTIHNADPKGGAAHQMTNEDANAEISKLVVGQTRTTTASGDGLGGMQSLIMQDQFTLSIVTDANEIGEDLTRLGYWILRVNFGEEYAEAYCPDITLAFEMPPNPKDETDRAQAMLEAGIPLVADEVYARTGWTKPKAGDEVIKKAPPPDPFGFGAQAAPPPPRRPANDVDVDEEVDAERAAATGGAPAFAAAMLEQQQDFRVMLSMPRELGDHVCLSKQPETVNGTPEVLIDKGVREAARQTEQWGAALAAAVGERTKPSSIFEALTRAAGDLPITAMARSLERRMMQGAMLGALDSVWERENDELIQPATFANIFADIKLDATPGAKDFVKRPFDEAVKFFKGQEVLHKDLFEQLSAAAKRRAFTVARLARQELLSAAHAELSRQIETSGVDSLGPSLPDFKRFIKERVESAGWTPANASHVETIFRTNVMSAHGGGRATEMTQPEVLRLRPYWQWQAVRDDRSRPSHKAAHGMVLSAESPVWRNVWTPAGYNCRCRVISRSAAWVKANSVRIATTLPGLPDDGWSGSGVMSFLSAA